MIGFGAIGQEIASALARLGESDRLIATLVRPGRNAPSAVHDVEALLARAPDCVIECAGQDAVRAFGAAILAGGVDLVASSIGVLADPGAAAALAEAERRGGGRLLLPAGAIGGLDCLAAAALGGLGAVTYSSYKPPRAWASTPAEQLIALDHAEEQIVFFEGSAREAAAAYPKNANVAVAVGIAGIGIDATRVRLISSRHDGDPRGVIEAEGALGAFRFDILAYAAPSNPKTSALTAYSLLQCARLGGALPVAGLTGARFYGDAVQAAEALGACRHPELRARRLP